MTRVTISIQALLFALIGTLVSTVGCDSNDVAEEPEPAIEEFAFTTDSVALEVGQEADFSDLLVGLTADGDTVEDPDLDLEWWSTDPDVFTVDNDGKATALDTGRAYCMAEMSDEAAAQAFYSKLAKFTGRDSFLIMVF